MNKIKKTATLCLAVLGMFSLAYFVNAGVNKDGNGKSDSTFAEAEVCTVSPTEHTKSEKSDESEQTQTVTESTTAKTTQSTAVENKTTSAVQTVTEKQTVKATVSVPEKQYDYDCFSDSAFLGNSRFVGLSNFGLCKNVFSKVSLNVKTVFTEKGADGTVVINNLNKSEKYRRIYIMFGDNEAGYPDGSFISSYKDIIKTVKKYQPDSKIYVISILPISAERSSKNVYGYNNSRINAMNELIKKMCSEENIEYVDVAECMKDKNGCLPADASSDGAHFGKSYYCKMLNYLMSFT